MPLYIYLLQNKINNKIYIGQTNNIGKRLSIYKSNNKKKTPIYRAINKYGFINFQLHILEVFDCSIELDNAEVFWIQYFESNKKQFGYNLASGGKVNRGMKRSKEYKENMSNIKKEYWKSHTVWNTGIPLSDEQKAHLSSIKGEKASKAKFSNFQIKSIRNEFWSNICCISDFAKEYNITGKGMAAILYNKCYIDEHYIITDDMIIKYKNIVKLKLSEYAKNQARRK